MHSSQADGTPHSQRPRASLSMATVVLYAAMILFAGGAAAQVPDKRAGLAPASDSLPNAERTASGNPLWAIPLTQLTNTRERPIFSPSRRPPLPVVVVQPFVPPPVVARAQPKPMEHPELALLGTIAGEGEALAMFIEPATQNVVRLRTGEAHRGWVLRSVRGRDARLEKGDRIEVVSLSDPGSGVHEAPTPSPPPPGPGIRGPRR
jgi:general secretion pathway protein N